MQLGAFSISLTVKDLATSRAFYEKLGFEVTGGDPAMNYLILVNGETILGLFQGMFDKNILTFNPGLNNKKETLTDYTDVRELQRELEAKGLTLTTRVDEEGEGAGSITLEDPDGNPILIDQFF
jgi:catechol 2,3-dioxygenase-like lactoylglutathione lyase family enzyme